MIVIFDGMDKVGKTTLIHALDKATNYEHIIIDRGPNSYLVYDKLYNRGKADDYHKTEMDLRNSSHLCVYCYADENDIKERLNAVGEEFPTEQGSISDVKELFDINMEASASAVLAVHLEEPFAEGMLQRRRRARGHAEAHAPACSCSCSWASASRVPCA